MLLGGEHVAQRAPLAQPVVDLRVGLPVRELENAAGGSAIGEPAVGAVAQGRQRHELLSFRERRQRQLHGADGERGDCDRHTRETHRPAAVAEEHREHAGGDHREEEQHDAAETGRRPRPLERRRYVGEQDVGSRTDRTTEIARFRTEGEGERERGDRQPDSDRDRRTGSAVSRRAHEGPRRQHRRPGPHQQQPSHGRGGADGRRNGKRETDDDAGYDDERDHRGDATRAAERAHAGGGRSDAGSRQSEERRAGIEVSLCVDWRRERGRVEKMRLEAQRRQVRPVPEQVVGRGGGTVGAKRRREGSEKGAEQRQRRHAGDEEGQPDRAAAGTSPRAEEHHQRRNRRDERRVVHRRESDQHSRDRDQRGTAPRRLAQVPQQRPEQQRDRPCRGDRQVSDVKEAERRQTRRGSRRWPPPTGDRSARR